jgi:hypothetical protein
MITVLELVNRILDNLGEQKLPTLSNAGTPARQALSALNDIYAELLQLLPMHEFIRTNQLITQTGVKHYSLPHSQLLAHTLKFENSVKKLKKITPEQALLLPTASTGEPSQFWISESTLTLWPTPDQNFTLNYSYSLAPEQLSQDSQVVVFPKDWERLLIRGSQALVSQFLGDHESARTHYSLYQEGLLLLKARMAQQQPAARMKSAYTPPHS